MSVRSCCPSTDRADVPHTLSCGLGQYVAKYRQITAVEDAALQAWDPSDRHVPSDHFLAGYRAAVAGHIELEDIPEITEKQGQILDAILNERVRQDEMKAAGRFSKTCADDMPIYQKFAVLGEEVGEVARAILQADETESTEVHKGVHVREELIQVAAVCVAWLESL